MQNKEEINVTMLFSSILISHAKQVVDMFYIEITYISLCNSYRVKECDCKSVTVICI